MKVKQHVAELQLVYRDKDKKKLNEAFISNDVIEFEDLSGQYVVSERTVYCDVQSICYGYTLNRLDKGFG